MKKILLISFTILLTINSYSQLTLDWAKRIGSANNETGRGIKTDNNQNVYIAGSFNGTVDFDPGAGSAYLSSTGNDIFILKLDSAGNFLWARSIGGIGDDEAIAITLDDSANVYITGYFQDTVDFDPDAGIFKLASAGQSDIFIEKLNKSGNFIWAKRLGGTGDDNGNSITTDHYGNTYTTGYFSNSPDFDPGTPVFSVASNGGKDIFIEKLDSAGSFIWVKTMGANGDDIGNSITIDANKNIISTGSFSLTPDFDPGPATHYLQNYAGTDIYVQKLDSLGNYLWAYKMGGAIGDDAGNAIATDTAGNILLTGYYFGRAEFSPDTINHTIFIQGLDLGVCDALYAPLCSPNMFVEKMSPSGAYIWAWQRGGYDLDAGLSIASDANGNVYTTGYENDSAYYNSSTSTTYRSGLSYVDYFVSIYNASGSGTWQKVIGGTGGDIGYGITVDNASNVYITGYFSGTPDFNTSIATLYYTSAGNHDIFIQKLGYCNHPSYSLIDTACSAFTINGLTYTSSGTYQQDLGSTSGCDSILIINLTVNNCAGISSFYLSNQITISPNPTSSHTTITFSSEQTNTTIKVVNVLGEEITQSTINGKQYTLDMSGYAKGIYFVKIIDANKNVVNRKIIKN